MENLILNICLFLGGKEVVKERRNGLKGVKLSSCLRLVSTLRVVEQFNL